MKKILKNRFLRLLLVFVMIFALTACGKPKDEPTEPIPEPPKETAKEMFFSVINAAPADGAASDSDGSVSLGFKEIGNFFSSSEAIKAISSMEKIEPSKSDFTLSAKIDPALLPPGPAQMVGNIVNDLSISFESKQDIEEAYFEAIMSLLITDKNIANIEIVANKDKLGVRSPEFHPDFISLAYEDIVPLMESLGLSLDGMGDMSSMLDFAKITKEAEALAEQLPLTPAQVQKLKKPYIDFLEEKLVEDDFTEEDDVEISDIPGQKYKKITFTLSGNDVSKIVSELAAKLMNDDDLFDIIREKYDVVYNYYKNIYPPALFDQMMLPKSSEVVSGAKELLQDIKESADDSTGSDYPNLVTVSFYFVDRSVKCVEILVKEEDSSTAVSIFIKNFTAADSSQKTVFDLTINDDSLSGGSATILVENTLKSSGATSSNETKISVPAFEDAGSPPIDILWLTEIQENEELFKFNVTGDDVSILDLSGNTKYSSDKKKTDFTFDAVVNIPGMSSGDAPTGSLSIVGSSEIGAAFDKVSLNNETCVEITPEAVDNGVFDVIQATVMQNFMTFAQKNMDLYQKYINS